MTEIEPGSGSFADSLERLADILREESAELERIERLSAKSFRMWLDRVIDQVSATLGITLARARALVDDYLTIAANARSTFWEHYHATRTASRRVRRRA